MKTENFLINSFGWLSTGKKEMSITSYEFRILFCVRNENNFFLYISSDQNYGLHSENRNYRIKLRVCACVNPFWYNIFDKIPWLVYMLWLIRFLHHFR